MFRPVPLCLQVAQPVSTHIFIYISKFHSYSEEEEDDRVGVYVGEMPVCCDQSYFEIEILDMDVQGAVSIGKLWRVLCDKWH